MRKIIGVLVVALLMSGRLASAQIVDPSTGMVVDAATDPMDFSAIMSGQPTNAGMEAALSASAQAQQIAAINMAQAEDSSEPAIDSTTASDDAPVVHTPALPRTPKPVITPSGGTFDGSVQVTIADSDPAAAVFYTTDGKRPTTSSERYQAPIVVTAKTKVQALAFDVNMKVSGVVSKKFKVKSAKSS